MITHTPPVTGNLPIKTLVARQRPTKYHTHIHTYMHTHTHTCTHTQIFREVSLALQQLHYGSESEDVMLETIRSEVKRLGTQEAITSEIIGADASNTTDYVIRRPCKTLTTRDYLSDKHRYVTEEVLQDHVHMTFRAT